MLRRSGLTLIELLIALCCVAALSAILFPVFASARSKGRDNSCISRLEKVGTATLQYVQDYDEKFYPNRRVCRNVCPEYLDSHRQRIPMAKSLSGGAERRVYWAYLLYPYLRDVTALQCPNHADAFIPGDSKTVNYAAAPGGIGVNDGLENSYGHNDAWISPGGIGLDDAAVPRIAATILLTDASYYAVAPDMKNQSGTRVTASCVPDQKAAPCAAENTLLLQQNPKGRAYFSYWKNIGNANWSASKGKLSSARAVALIKTRHNGLINTQFADGHVKGMPWKRITGDICLWTTDLEGPHPQCN